MSRLLIGLLAACFVFSSPAQAQGRPAGARFDFASISVGQVVQLLYAEAMSTPFVLDPEVIADVRAVSFRYSTEKGDLRAFLRAFLDSLGYVIQQRDGVDFISKRKPYQSH